MRRLELKTQKRTQFIDITSKVAEAVRSSGVQDGFCYVFVPHTTAALTINEHADPSVARDLELALERLAPWNGRYEHREGNSAAHIKASLLGSSQWVCVENSRLQLGTWQGIFFCEFDGPRQRQVWIRLVNQAVDA
ncbi:MAG: YjbQ family protein [Firmicutes bacterium]|nr:YjbQ family protein [Bacillota bacterium]